VRDEVKRPQEIAMNPRSIMTILLGMFALWGCATSAVALRDLPQATVEEYTLDSGDRLGVTVFGHEDLSASVTVDGSGNISLPLIGSIAVSGKALPEVDQAIVTALLDGYLSAPRVTVEVLNYRPYYILGEVNKPGSYPFIEGLTVVNAVATAEGFSYRADMHRVFIKRSGNVDEVEYSLTPNTPVYPGDTIRISDRRF